MNQPLATDTYISPVSETDAFSDSDWLDIASNRGSSDNESVSSNNGGVSSSLSRRSSFSTSSSHDDEIDAWEGFIEDSSDETEARRGSIILDSGAVDEDHSNSPFLDLDNEHVEERRVRDGLEQSLTSTLGASRSSSHSSTVHSSLRDLRLSFPDPLNNSHDELNRSFDRVSSSEAIIPVTAITAKEDELDVSGTVPMQDPGSFPTPAVLGQVPPSSFQFNFDAFSASLQVVLYGTPTPSKVPFVNELFRKAIAGAELAGIESETEHLKPAILDRTGDAMPRSDYASDRPSLAIIFLPYTLVTIPQHSAYLPVFFASSENLFEKEFQEAQETWTSYDLPTNRVVRLEGSSTSSLFAAEDVDKLDPYRTYQAVQHITKREKAASWAGFFEQFNTVHAVTLFALLCIIAGFSVNTALRGTVVLSPSPTVAEKTNNNQSTALAVRTTSSISVIPAAMNYSAVYSRGAVSSVEAGPSTVPASPKPENRNAGPITHLEDTLMTWAERMKVSKDIMLRPSTSISSQSSGVVVSEASAVLVTSTPAAQESSSALALRLVDSVAEIVFASVKALVETVEHDLKDIIVALDELVLAIQRSTRAVAEQSKNVAQVVREQLEYRNARAKGKAREIKERGMQIMSYAGSTFLGRATKMKQEARSLKEKVVSSEYVKNSESFREKLSQRTEHAKRRARRGRDELRSRRFVMDL